MVAEKEWIAYVNGEYLPQSQAKVSIFDHGFLWGDGVYDALCVFNGYIMELDRHVDRLFRSIQSFHLDMPLSKEKCKEAIIKVAETNGDKSQYIKIIVTSGVGPHPVMNRKDCKTTVVIFSRPFFFLVSREDEYEKGIKTIITSLRRIPAQCLDPKAKNLNYANFVLAEHEAQTVGMDMAIMLDIHGFVNEGPGYNIFVVRQGRISTPPSGNILMGVTRETIFDICKEEGIEIVEEQLVTYDLYTADEIFMSNSISGVTVVVEVDGRTIASGKPGPVTQRLRKVYLDWAEKGVHGTLLKTK
ncbi:branched-chain-amino-acid transaminase [Chloroflexota bacterium]